MIPGEDAVMVKVPAERILRPVRLSIPLALFPVAVPEMEPVGDRVKVIG